MQLFSSQQKQDVSFCGLGCCVCIVLELCNVQNFSHISKQSFRDTFNPGFVTNGVCVCVLMSLFSILFWLQRGSSGSGERDLYVVG